MPEIASLPEHSSGARPLHSALWMGPFTPEEEGELLTLLRRGVSVILVTPVPVHLPESFKRFSNTPKGVESLLQLLDWDQAPAQPVRILDGLFGERELELLKGLEQSTGFNLGQYQAQHVPVDADVELRAGAGTGKTQTMVARVLFLLHHDVSPDAIALLTFTREATSIMRERLAKSLAWRLRLTGNQKYLRWLAAVPQMQISTIHSFARVLLKRLGAAVGHSPSVRVRSWRHERRRIIEQRLSAQLNIQANISQQIAGWAFHDFVHLVERFASQLENEGLSIPDIRKLDWGVHGPALKVDLQQLLCDVLSELEKRKAADGSIELSNLTRDAWQAVCRLSERRQLVSGFSHLFVDEFQDTDDIQIDLLCRLATAGSGARVFAVGDVKQSIYRFRGAEYTAFNLLRERLKGAGRQPRSIFLQKNYRTVPGILEPLRRVWFQWGHKELLPYAEPADRLIPTRREGEGTALLVHKCEPTDIDTTFRVMVKQLAGASLAGGQGAPFSILGDTAVLVRTNQQARHVKKLCESIGVPCDIDMGGSLFASPAAKDLHTLVLALLHPEDPVALVDLLNSPWVHCSLPWQRLYATRGDPLALRRMVVTQVRSHGLWTRLIEHSRTRPVLAVLREALECLVPEAMVRQRAIAQLAQEGTLVEDEATRQARHYLACMDRLLSLLAKEFDDDFLSLVMVNHWLELNIATNREEKEPETQRTPVAGRLRCITVHQAKGREFDTVLIPFTDRCFHNRGEMLVVEEPPRTKGLPRRVGWMLSGGNGPLMNSHFQKLQKQERTEIDCDETRLFYVAMTRAKNRLWLLVPNRASMHTWGGLWEMA